MISVLLIDDNALIRACLASVLAHEPDIDVVGQVSCECDKFIIAQQRCLPDVIIVNCFIDGGCGLWCVHKLMQKNAHSKIIILIMHESIQIVEHALKLGVKGVLTKKANPSILLDSIRTISAGGSWIDGDLAKTIVFRRSRGKSGMDALSAREFEIFLMLAKGLECRDISKILHISIKTAAVHRTNINSKLGLKNIAALIHLAREYQLLPVSEHPK